MMHHVLSLSAILFHFSGAKFLGFVFYKNNEMKIGMKFSEEYENITNIYVKNFFLDIDSAIAWRAAAVAIPFLLRETFKDYLLSKESSISSEVKSNLLGILSCDSVKFDEHVFSNFTNACELSNYSIPEFVHNAAITTSSTFQAIVVLERGIEQNTDR